MTSRIRLSDDDLPTGVPAHLRAALLEFGLPAQFQRFDLVFARSTLRIDASFPVRLVLATTESGEMSIHLADGSVWWAQTAIQHETLEVFPYDQFVNSDLKSFCACVEAADRLLANGSWEAPALAAAIETLDPNALDRAREGVWCDAVDDVAAGL